MVSEVRHLLLEQAGWPAIDGALGSRYDGTGRTETAIEVFATTTGKTLGICRRMPFEAKSAWIARALDRVEREAA
jgi:hypothetical protein